MTRISPIHLETPAAAAPARNCPKTASEDLTGIEFVIIVIRISRQPRGHLTPGKRDVKGEKGGSIQDNQFLRNYF